MTEHDLTQRIDRIFDSLNLPAIMRSLGNIEGKIEHLATKEYVAEQLKACHKRHVSDTGELKLSGLPKWVKPLVYSIGVIASAIAGAIASQ